MKPNDIFCFMSRKTDKGTAENIRWFSRLSLTQKIVAIEEQIRWRKFVKTLKWQTEKNPGLKKQSRP